MLNKGKMNIKKLESLYNYIISIEPGINVNVSMAETSQHHETYPYDMEKILEFLEKEGRKGMRVLDIGSGLGFPVAAFAMSGYRASGVEHDIEFVRHSRKKLERMHNDGRIKTLPQIIHANFFIREFQNLIPEYDAFFSYNYGAVHARELLGALKKAHSGAMFLVEQRYFTPEILSSTGFSPIYEEDSESYLIKN